MNVKLIRNTVIVIVVALAILIVIQPPSIANKIDNDSVFSYTTSITGRFNPSEKADIYTTDMSVPEAAAYIISIKRPYSYTNLSNEEFIQLEYDDHYILIYKGENSTTYVQVSSRKYIHHNGYYGLYRPYHRNIIVFYDNSYKSSRYYRTDSQRFGGGGYYKQTSTSKIRTDSNSSSKIRTDSNSSSKIRTNKSNSVRSGSVGTRSRIGGGTSFGK